MGDQHQRALAEIARREQVARVATPGPWEAYRATSYFGARQRGAPAHAGRVSMSSNRNQANDAAYIADNDPKQKLRELAAARSTLTEHAPLPGLDGQPRCTTEALHYPCPTARPWLDVYGGPDE